MVAKTPFENSYKELATACYIVVASYEQYLLDQISSKQLAEVMLKLLEKLPEISESTREALRSSETLSEKGLG
tara:strand:+ start:563 stop:781 length:219 start_codon:yes stop_codon:yes gene_type:complete